MLPIAVPQDFRIIAHRGASAYAPENTHAAFALTQRMGVREIETDTQLTRDGEVVLCHDATLARYGHGERVVEEMSWAELAALDMGSWFSPALFGGAKMITLDDLLATYGDGFIYHVEIKGKADELPAAVHESLTAHGLLDHTVITSFNYAALEAMRAIDATVRMGWLVRTIDAETVARAEALNLFQLCPMAANVDVGMVSLARQVTPEVRAWGLSGTSAQHERGEVATLIERVLAAGCDGMTINWPDWVRHTSSQPA